MTAATFRIAQAAFLLGVSDDTVRRWIDDGTLPGTRDEQGRQAVAGADLAAFAQRTAHDTPTTSDPAHRSARNSFTGLVTKVQKDGVMAQVDLQCGPFRVVSLISAESAQELGLEVGTLATAVVKATNVSIEVGTLR